MALDPSQSLNALPRSAAASPTVAELRAKLDRAILAEEWDAVKAIRERIVEIERAGTIDLATERAKRGGR